MGYKKIYITLFWLVVFAGLLFLTSYISLNHEGMSYYTEQFLQTLIIIAAMALVLRVVRKVIWPLYQEKTGRMVAHILMDLTDFVVIATGVLLIVVFVFDKDLFSIAAAGGLITAALAIALQGVIQDMFGAVVLDVDVPYKVGDWIKVNKDIEGEVLKITWRHTELLYHDQVTYVPNGHIIRSEFTNFNQPEPWVSNAINLTLEASIPVDRAQRIMHAAVMKLDQIYNHECDVYAHTISDKGITYFISYKFLHQKDRHRVRHRVIKAVTEALRMYDIEVADQMGEYLVRTVGPEPTKIPELDFEQIIRFNPLFKDAPDEIIEKARSLGRPQTFSEGSPIVTKGEQGTSLYLIAEGAAVVIFSQKDKKFDRLLAFPDFFGERALYLNEPRNSTITAKTDVVLFELTRESMGDLFKEHPQLIDTISNVISERDKDRLQALALKETKKIPDKQTLAQKIGAQIRELLRL